MLDLTILSAYKSAHLSLHKLYVQLNSMDDTLISTYTKYDTFYEDIADRLVGLYGLEVLNLKNIVLDQTTELDKITSKKRNLISKALYIEHQMYNRISSFLKEIRQAKKNQYTKSKFNYLTGNLEDQLTLIEKDIDLLTNLLIDKWKEPLLHGSVHNKQQITKGTGFKFLVQIRTYDRTYKFHLLLVYLFYLYQKQHKSLTF